MKSIYRTINYSFLLFCTVIITHCTQHGSNVTKLSEPTSSKGTISFTLELDSSLSNGYNEEVFIQNLVELPGLGACRIQRTRNFVAVQLVWLNKEEFTAAYIQTQDLPGPSKYHILFTWDAEQGLFDGYFNGINYRTEKTKYYEPWEMTGSSDTLIIPSSSINVSDVKVIPRFITSEEALKFVPDELIGKNEYLLGDLTFPAPMDLTNRKGELFYSNKFDKEVSIKDWILEGPAKITFDSKSMILESTLKNPRNGSDGHFNFWCPDDLPESFIAEWEYQQLSDKGISLVFFSGKGKNGEDVFDTSLVKRDGHFQPYVNGDINNYWIVFYSNNRTMRMTNMAKCYLAKSSKSSILSLGKLGIEPDHREFNKIRLIKDGSHIQFQVDGEVCVDFTDPCNERWGPVLGAGKFSFRQMAVTKGAYRNFYVWRLNN